MRFFRVLTPFTLLVTLTAAVQQALVGTGVLVNSYDGATLGWVIGIAIVALLVFGIAIAVASGSDRVVAELSPSWTVALVFVAASALVIAHFHAYDPYYAPQLRRNSDDGGSWAWPLALASLSLVAAIAVRRFGTIALALGGMVLWGCAFVAIGPLH